MDISGNLLEHFNIPPTALGIPADKAPTINVLKHLRPTRIIRASHRQLDSVLGKAHHPVLSHNTIQQLGPNEVVKLEIALWPCGIAFDAGESLVLTRSGHDMRFAEFPPLYGSFRSGNKGTHRICCGEAGHQRELTRSGGATPMPRYWLRIEFSSWGRNPVSLVLFPSLSLDPCRIDITGRNVRDSKSQMRYVLIGM